jgi:hypothetical protein
MIVAALVELLSLSMIRQSELDLIGIESRSHLPLTEPRFNPKTEIAVQMVILGQAYGKHRP